MSYLFVLENYKKSKKKWHLVRYSERKWKYHYKFSKYSYDGNLNSLFWQKLKQTGPYIMDEWKNNDEYKCVLQKRADWGKNI